MAKPGAGVVLVKLMSTLSSGEITRSLPSSLPFTTVTLESVLVSVTFFAVLFASSCALSAVSLVL